MVELGVNTRSRSGRPESMKDRGGYLVNVIADGIHRFFSLRLPKLSVLTGDMPAVSAINRFIESIIEDMGNVQISNSVLRLIGSAIVDIRDIERVSLSSFPTALHLTTRSYSIMDSTERVSRLMWYTTGIPKPISPEGNVPYDALTEQNLIHRTVASDINLRARLTLASQNRLGYRKYQRLQKALETKAKRYTPVAWFGRDVGLRQAGSCRGEQNVVLNLQILPPTGVIYFRRTTILAYWMQIWVEVDLYIFGRQCFCDRLGRGDQDFGSSVHVKWKGRVKL